MGTPTADARGLRERAGAALRRRREAAGLTQDALARQVGYSRSTIANAERGDLRAAEVYERCDRALRAGGEIVLAYRAARAVTIRPPPRDHCRPAPAHGHPGPNPAAAPATKLVEHLRLHWHVLIRRYERQA